MKIQTIVIALLFAVVLVPSNSTKAINYKNIGAKITFPSSVPLNEKIDQNKFLRRNDLLPQEWLNSILGGTSQDFSLMVQGDYLKFTNNSPLTNSISPQALPTRITANSFGLNFTVTPTQPEGGWQGSGTLNSGPIQLQLQSQNSTQAIYTGTVSNWDFLLVTQAPYGKGAVIDTNTEGLGSLGLSIIWNLTTNQYILRFLLPYHWERNWVPPINPPSNGYWTMISPSIPFELSGNVTTNPNGTVAFSTATVTYGIPDILWGGATETLTTTTEFQGVGISISGQITNNTNPVSGVTVNLTGTTSASTTTDASGNYTFNNLTSGGNYTVTPTRSGFTFTPPSQTFNNITSNQTANFTASGGYDLTVEEFEPVQTVYYPRHQSHPNDTPVQLVKGKATAAKVVVKVVGYQEMMNDSSITNIPLRIGFQGNLDDTHPIPKSEFVSGSGNTGEVTKYVSLTAPTNLGATLSFADVCVSGCANEFPNNNNNNSRSGNVTDTGTLKILYVPINGFSRYGVTTYPNAPNVQNTIIASNNFIRKVYPLAETNGVITGLASPIIGYPYLNYDPGDPGNGMGNRVQQIDTFTLHQLADQLNYDKAVGLVHFDYFDKYTRDPCITGVVYSQNINAAIVIAKGSYLNLNCEGYNNVPLNQDGDVTAHELGHTLGIGFVTQPNEEYTATSPGNIINEAYSASEQMPINSTPNNLIYCFMGNWNGTNWIDQGHYEFLRGRIANNNQNLGGSLIDTSGGQQNLELITNKLTTTSFEMDDGQLNILNSKNHNILTNKFTKTKKTDYLVISAIANRDNITPLTWYTTNNSRATNNDSATYTVKTFDSFGNLVSETPANIGYKIQKQNTQQESIGLLITKLQLSSNLATIQILFDGKIIAKYSVAAKFLRDAVEGIPNSGFVSVPDMLRRELLEKVDVIEKLIEAGKEQQALRVLEDELKPKLQIYLPVNYSKETFLQFERPEVFAAVDLAAERLNLQIKQRAEGK